MNIKKECTFYYQELCERQAYEPIAREASRRGYSVEFTDDITRPSEIGFYCSHINHPENSKLSFIMFHGMDQGRVRWPNMWIREPWNKYDVGLLPGSSWVERWQKCTRDPVVHPRKGVYEIGWPKADLILNSEYCFSSKVEKRI